MAKDLQRKAAKASTATIPLSLSDNPNVTPTEQHEQIAKCAYRINPAARRASSMIFFTPGSSDVV